MTSSSLPLCLLYFLVPSLQLPLHKSLLPNRVFLLLHSCWLPLFLVSLLYSSALFLTKCLPFPQPFLLSPHLLPYFSSPPPCSPLSLLHSSALLLFIVLLPSSSGHLFSASFTHFSPLLAPPFPSSLLHSSFDFLLSPEFLFCPHPLFLFSPLIFSSIAPILSTHKSLFPNPALLLLHFC